MLFRNQKQENYVDDEHDHQQESDKQMNLSQIRVMGSTLKSPSPKPQLQPFSQMNSKMTLSEIRFPPSQQPSQNYTQLDDFQFENENIEQSFNSHHYPHEYMQDIPKQNQDQEFIDPDKFNYNFDDEDEFIHNKGQTVFNTPHLGSPVELKKQLSDIEEIPQSRKSNFYTEPQIINPLQNVHNLSFSHDGSFNSKNPQTRQGKINQVFFYYDLIPKNVKSTLLSESAQNPKMQILKQTVIPLILVVILHFALTRIQESVADFCYIDDICQCKSFSIQLWSFVKQLFTFKLGLMVYKKVIISQMVKKKYSTSKIPYMEMIMVYFLTIIFDFFTVVWLEHNSEFVFAITTYFIGLVVLLNTIRTKDILTSLTQGRGFIFYDILYVLLFVIVQRVLPYIQAISLGVLTYYTIFPFIDWFLDSLYDLLLKNSYQGSLFLNQMELIIIGIRYGTILTYTYTDFAFWYLIFLITLRRMNSMTLIVTIFIRKRLFQCTPLSFRKYMSMSEAPLTVKARNGGSIEHLFWIVFFIIFKYDQHILVFQIRDTTLIRSCQFNSLDFLEYYDTKSAFIVFIAFTTQTLLAVLVNSTTRYDNIKWVGGQNFTLVENVLTRSCGYYFFCATFIFALLVKNYSNAGVYGYHFT